ncbi:MAG TPA: OmpA family protein [Candidatus Kapabacteria bacterium]|nr:OmpA family protein [Candidatus Kapabacteria bacterium]
MSRRSHPLLMAMMVLAIPLAHARAQMAEDTVPHRAFWELAVSPAAVMTLPTGRLESILGSVPCSNTYAAAATFHPGIGVRIGYVLPHERSGALLRLRGIQLDGGYDDISSLFTATDGLAYDAFDNTNGRYTTVRTEQRAAFTIGSIRAQLAAEMLLDGHLMVRIGPSINLPIAGSVRESEAITAPSNAHYLDRTQEREMSEGTGTLTGLKMRAGVGAVLAYRLPIGRRMFLEPVLGADLALTHVQPAWSPLLARIGIAFGFMAIPSQAPAPLVAAPPAAAAPAAVDTATAAALPVETPAAERPFTAEASIEVAAEHLPIEFRRQIVARYIPLLPTIFFEKNQAAFASRYDTLPPQESDTPNAARGFDENTISSNAEAAHYRTLNVFAGRMRALPRARVTITGTTSRDEDARPALAQRRAETVAKYLEDVWGIAPGRITVRSRLDPAVPSNPEYAEGRDENRRVELEFNDDAVYRPVQLRSVEPMTEPDSIPFRISATSSSPVARWRAQITAEGMPLATLAGDGEPEGMAVWHLTDRDRERVLSTGTVSYGMRVYDSSGRSTATTPKAMPVRIDTTVSVARSATERDNSAEFLLVTFDFDRADLTRRGRLELNAILDRIGPDSRLSITGYTDQVGEGEHNRALALERARKVASFMPAGTPVQIRGAAPEEAPYSRNSPEGRFLSRTVRVVVTNPK